MVVTTNGFALNHDKKLQIYFFCVKRQAKNDFLKDVESTVCIETLWNSHLPIKVTFLIYNVFNIMKTSLFKYIMKIYHQKMKIFR